MKNIFTLLILIMSFSTYGQLVIEKKPEKKEIGNLSNVLRLSQYDDGTYVFIYRNYEYEHLVEMEYFTMEETGNDLETLYVLINNMIVEKPEDYLTLKLGDDHEIVIGYRPNSFGVVISHYEGGHYTGRTLSLNTKRLDKLFGKPKRSLREAKTPLPMPE